jgi:hypothetical protein
MKVFLHWIGQALSFCDLSYAATYMELKRVDAFTYASSQDPEFDL